MAQPGDDRHEGGAVVFADSIVGAGEADRHRRQIAEHVLTQGKARGIGLIVPLHAVDEGQRIRRFVMDVFGGAALLLAFVLDLARLAQDVDGGAAHLVDEIVGFEREVLGDFLAHQHGLAGDVHAAAAVFAVKEVRAVIGQHIGGGGAHQEQRRDHRKPTHCAMYRRPHHQLQPQPPPALPVAPRDPSRVSRM
jgi:hypothetical protein